MRLWPWGTKARAAVRAQARMRPAEPQGRPSWYWFVTNGRSQAIIPIEKELAVYDDMRRLFPVIDAAIDKIIRMVGGVVIEGSRAVVDDLTRWTQTVQVNQTQRGLETWLGTHIDQMLMYGKGVGEIVPNTRRNEIYALTNLEAKTILLRAGDSPLQLRVYQRQQGPHIYVELTPGWYLHSMHRPRGDNPHGTSLLRSLAWVCDILSCITNAMSQTWEREGAPSYHVNWLPDASFSDPDGTLAQKVVDNLGAQFADIMSGRKTGDIKDFFSSGDVKVSTIGSDHKALVQPEGYRIFAEQVVAAVGLPAWMLGLHWSTTERLSTVQAEMILADIEAIRREVQPQIEYLLDLRQRLVGRSARFRVAWREVTLTDLTETARAEGIREQARADRIENSRRMWALGYWTQTQAAQDADPDLLAPATTYDVPPEGPTGNLRLPLGPNPVAPSARSALWTEEQPTNGHAREAV